MACAIFGACWLHEPGGPGLSSALAALAFAALLLVFRACGAGALGCLGALAVLAGVGQVALTRTPPAPDGALPTMWARAGPLVVVAAGLVLARWARGRGRRGGGEDAAGQR